MKELFTLIDNELRQAGFKNKTKAGIVLTGGGSLLKGVTELAEEVFGQPTRIGVPLELGAGLSNEIESPEFATVAGLIRGVPGTTSSQAMFDFKAKTSMGNLGMKKFFKKVQEFFDEL